MTEPKNNPKNEALPPLPLLGSLEAVPCTFNVHGEIWLDPVGQGNNSRQIIVGSLEVAQGAYLQVVGTLEKIKAGTYLALFNPKRGTVVICDGGPSPFSVVMLAGEVSEGFAAAYLEALEVEAALARVENEPDEGKGAPWREG